MFLPEPSDDILKTLIHISKADASELQTLSQNFAELLISLKPLTEEEEK